ncbi:MAG TPA: hypothetical protein VGI99_11950 [Gemmataceae bacterium]|jgi:hypothetical protein
MASFEYLVHHGCAGHLGRFRATDLNRFGRGISVVVKSRRGLELGEVLCPSGTGGAVVPDPVVGDLIRAATDDDFVAANRQRELGQRVFADGSHFADVHGLPLTLVDVEVLLDGRQALVHAIRFGPCDEGPLLADIGERNGLIVRLHDLAGELPPEVEADEHGCGSCGEGGGCGEGGCSSGGCGSCSSGGAKELSTYFAALREQMDQRPRIALL